MLIRTIKTHKVKPQESIIKLLDTYLPKLPENSVVAIASKVISHTENRLIPKNKIKNKNRLINQEAELILKPGQKTAGFFLTLKNNRLIPNAGIDESNSNNFYALLPLKPQLTAQKIWQFLRKKHQIKNFGIIITDSNLTPLRAGVTGIAIGWCGFKPIYSYIGKKDIFNQPLKVTQINLLDSLATAATLVMGEGREQTPLAIITDVPQKIVFQNRPPTKKEENSASIVHQKDLYSTILSYE